MILPDFLCYLLDRMGLVHVLTLKQQQAVALESYQFWMSVGLTHNEACGLIGNEQQESSFDHRALGDKGTAFGSFQFHAARCAVIKAGCGIDIITFPSHADQLTAAWWELNHPEHHALTMLDVAISSYQAGAIVSKYWLRPAAVALEMARRGAMAQVWDTYFTALCAS